MQEKYSIIEEKREISPYDASYPLMLLSKGINEQLQLAEKMIDTIYKTVSKDMGIVAQLHQATKGGFRYVVDLSDDMLKQIDSGKIKLMTTKTGKVTAQIVEENGHFGSKLSIKKENYRQGINPVDMGNTMQLLAMQEQLDVLAGQIISIDNSVKDVLQGQQNDRLGLYYSGLAMYLEAQNVDNVDLRKSLIVQALHSLADASFQLIITMQSDIKYLTEGKYNSEKGKRQQLIDARMRNINESFEFIHQASLLRAAIYCEQKEINAMVTVLDEYSHFIDTTIAKNACLLAQCDVIDKGAMGGLWKRRAELKLDVSTIKKQLETDDKVVYIGIKEA